MLQTPGSEPTIGVNLSLRQVAHTDLVADIGEALALSGLPAGALHLEITESVLMEDTEANRETLGLIKALGVTLVLDDFGTGYSSLAHLRQFPIDILKIDRSFVDGLDGSETDSTIVDAILKMSRGLRLSVDRRGHRERRAVRAPGRARLRARAGLLLRAPAAGRADRAAARIDAPGAGCPRGLIVDPGRGMRFRRGSARVRSCLRSTPSSPARSATRRTPWPIAARSPAVPRGRCGPRPAVRSASSSRRRASQAWTLVGQTRIAWDDVRGVESERTLLGRRTLRIRGSAGRIDIAPVLPGYEELERRVLAGQPAAIAA